MLAVGQVEDDWTSGASGIRTVIRLFSVTRNATLRPLPSGIGGALALMVPSTSVMMQRCAGARCMWVTRCPYFMLGRSYLESRVS
jgi:hypothetical protein